MATAHSIHMTETDVQFFEDEGYLLYHHPLFSIENFDALKAQFEELLENLPPGTRPEPMDVAHIAYPKLFDWRLAEEVIDLLKWFLGRNIPLWSSQFISNPPRDGRPVAWHEDSAYWAGRLNPMEVITIWLAIDDSTIESGCMRVIPGTHHHGFSKYEPVDRNRHVFGTRIQPGQLHESEAVYLELRAGGCHVHHAKLIHGSNTNRSQKRRYGYTMRYIPTSVKYENESHAIYLARGHDIAGNVYTDPTKPFEKGIRDIYRP